MRLPLDSIYITNKHMTAGYGYFGRHMGWDLRASVGTPVYAKSNGVVTERYVGTSGTQVLSVRYADYEHRYLHLSLMYPRVGETVKQGQLIAKSGNTGNVPAHLHEDIRKAGTSWTSSMSNYINPEVHYAALLNPTKGVEVANATQVNNLYRAILHREGDAGGIKNYTGRDANQIVSEMLGSQEFKAHQNFLTSATKQLTDLQTALRNEQNKPPVQVIKEVDKIVERIVKVEVPVEIIKTVEPTWLKAAVDFIRSVLRIKE